MLTLGLDLSTVSTGWAVVDGSSLVDKGIIDFESKTSHKERLVILSNLLSTIINKHKIKRAVIEDTYVAKNVATTKLLNKYSGVAIYTLYKTLGNDVEIIVISPQTIRSAHFPKDKKRQTKDYMYHYIISKYKLASDVPNDLTDAIAAALSPGLKTMEAKWIL